MFPQESLPLIGLTSVQHGAVRSFESAPSRMFGRIPDALAVVLINACVAITSEIILYLWVYRTSGFRSVKVSVVTTLQS